LTFAVDLCLQVGASYSVDVSVTLPAAVGGGAVLQSSTAFVVEAMQPVAKLVSVVRLRALCAGSCLSLSDALLDTHRPALTASVLWTVPW
jgi:hypothetical protein